MPKLLPVPPPGVSSGSQPEPAPVAGGLFGQTGVQVGSMTFVLPDPGEVSPPAKTTAKKLTAANKGQKKVEDLPFLSLDAEAPSPEASGNEKSAAPESSLLELLEEGLLLH